MIFVTDTESKEGVANVALTTRLDWMDTWNEEANKTDSDGKIVLSKEYPIGTILDIRATKKRYHNTEKKIEVLDNDGKDFVVINIQLELVKVCHFQKTKDVIFSSS